MPHLTVEYTKNLTSLNANGLLLQLNQALAAAGNFEDIDIKSRAIALDNYLVGTTADDKAFVHVKLSILSGRTSHVKQALSNSLLQVLSDATVGIQKMHIQLCVEILEIDRETYTKATLAH
jgi:5-carboxymethyl-2-hydroxymuconate isomerase